MASDEDKMRQSEQKSVFARPMKRRGVHRFLWVLVVLGGLAGAAYVYRDEPMIARFTGLVGVKHDLQHEPHSAPLSPANELAVKPGGDTAKAERKVLYYTCSMHPEVKSDKPGKCPICGMNLTPVYAEEESSSKEVSRPVAKAAGDTAKAERKVLYYTCSMHPEVKSNQPGKCPICGMNLTPVYAEEESTSKGQAQAVGTFKISPERQQLIGVKFGEVRERVLSKVIRASGQVSYDETRIAHIHTRVSGWIDKLYVDYTGMLVKKGQPLLTLYSPELVSTQQELLIALKAKDSLGTSNFTQGIGSNAFSLYESTRERLRLWDIPESEIKEIERRGTPNKQLTLYSPINGFVLTRNGFSGHRVTPEMELYGIVDLSNIWVLADVYEYELPMIKVGQTTAMTLASFPGRTFTGKVAYIYPGLEAATRTLRIRLEFPNPGYELKPDMYANVEIKVDYGMQLAVPRDAVLDAGTVQVVFVAREGGTFEPRKVSLGQQVGDQVIVLSGVKGGERVVTSANFLVDSESQLKAALGSLTGGEPTGH
jgi:membrane fusion protein, copper/silver efflux system